MRDFVADIDWSRWSETLWTSGVRVLAIVVIIFIALRILERLLEPAIRSTITRQMRNEPEIEVEQRIDTLTSVIYRTAWLVAVMAGLITILPEFGINASALLAGAGLIGLAVGFGAQSLVKDVIAGLFILIENQYGKGDVVTIAGVGGTVEDVNLRRTLIRDLDGTQHSVPNGEIVVSSNKTQVFSRVNEVIGVSYGDNLEQVFQVINKVGEELAGESPWSDDIISAPTVLGVDGFGDSSVDIRVVGDTQPGRQWAVTREFRLRIKLAFDAEAIEIPYPHQTLVTAGQKAADGVLVRRAAEE
ncbi:MAG: mechanosensitive ion channel family protein [Chloroflexi bacterium]|nr:mechanosensitive ion channel family protein [Chloroflexota bacterium]